MKQETAIKRAVSMLRQQARDIREPCSGGPGNDWACGTCPDRNAKGVCSSQREYTRLIETANALKAIK